MADTGGESVDANAVASRAGEHVRAEPIPTDAALHSDAPQEPQSQAKTIPARALW